MADVSGDSEERRQGARHVLLESDTGMKFAHKAKVGAGEIVDLAPDVLAGLGVFLSEDAAIFGI